MLSEDENRVLPANSVPLRRGACCESHDDANSHIRLNANEGDEAAGRSRRVIDLARAASPKAGLRAIRFEGFVIDRGPRPCRTDRALVTRAPVVDARRHRYVA